MAASGSNKIRNAKLVLLGDVRAGKSSLVFRFVKGQFVEFQESTIGAAFFSQALGVNDGTVKFEIWDTAGQQRNHLLEKKKWVQELQAQGKLCFYAGSVNKEDVDCILYLKTCQALNPGP